MPEEDMTDLLKQINTFNDTQAEADALPEIPTFDEED